MQAAPGAPPIYHRIAAVLREEILGGRLAAGERLATIRDLAGRYGVAQDTVRQALQVLRADGLVRSRQGSGTFVAEVPAPRTRLIAMDWDGFLRGIRDNSARVLETDDRPPALWPQEGHPSPGYRRMLRVHSDSDGAPYGLAEVFLDHRLYLRAPRRFETRMVLAVLEEVAGESLGEVRQHFAVGLADDLVAEHLGIAIGAPVGRIRRLALTADGEVAYLSIGTFRGDAVAFETILRPRPV